MSDFVHRLYQVPKTQLPISRSTLLRLIKNGKIKTVKISDRAVGILDSEIQRYLAEINA